MAYLYLVGIFEELSLPHFPSALGIATFSKWKSGKRRHAAGTLGVVYYVGTARLLGYKSSKLIKSMNQDKFNK